MIRIIFLLFVFSAGQSCHHTAGHINAENDLALERRQNQNGSQQTRPADRYDFSNFTFPAFKDWGEITLINGKAEPSLDVNGRIREMGYTLAFADYGLDSRSRSHAIVVLAVQTGGSAIVHLAYMFDLSSSAPKLKWTFVSGDRADNGLRSIHFTDSNVVLETYEKEGAAGVCCPQSYNSAVYKIENENLRLISKQSNLPNPDKRASLIAPARYQ